MNVKTNYRKYTYKTGMHISDQGEPSHKDAKEIELQNKSKKYALTARRNVQWVKKVF